MIFRHYMRRIHHKVRPSDPHYLQICILAGRVRSPPSVYERRRVADLLAQIEQWTEARYPSWIFETRPPIPATREEAEAKGIRDTRIRQLPSNLAMRKRKPEYKPPGDKGWSDTSIIMCAAGDRLSPRGRC
jgi:hypothetical protein